MNRFLKFATCCCMSQVVFLSFAQYTVNVQHVHIPVREGHHRMGHPGPKGKEILVNNLYMTIGGKPVLPVMGEFHHERYDKRYWKDVLLKMKASGVDIVSAYLLWMYHEEIENEFDFTGNNNLKEFLQLCKDVDIKVHLRMGPYCNAECRNGGIPDWMKRKEQVRVRYNDPAYLNHARRLYQHYARQMEGFYYKDNGPVAAVQLENEYVEPHHVIPHMMELKKIALECGINVPVYSMTHWMSSDYPKNEVIPYAGYYIEMPWDASTKKLPPSDYLYFSYNRISDNIGTDLIKKSDDFNTLDASEYESPYFTCEVGLGNQITLHRRPILDAASAGSNINLRLGCGVSLMGYYMYSGGSHRIGELTTTQAGNCSRISYDFMAPLSEFGEITPMYKEVKKYNYLMNDFGGKLAASVACLPVSNTDTSNLQWAVRVHDGSGFLFCSNYQRVWSRKEYKNVQFQVKLPHETLTIPSQPVDIVDKAYFMWPFNQNYKDVLLKYATVQPVCSIQNGDLTTCFFFEDDRIPAEYVFDKQTVQVLSVQNARTKEFPGYYRVEDIRPGTNSFIDITTSEGNRVRFVTLTSAQSNNLWRGRIGGKEYALITDEGIKFSNGAIELSGAKSEQHLLIYPAVEEIRSTAQFTKKAADSIFSNYSFRHTPVHTPVSMEKVSPFDGASWIGSDHTNTINKTVYIHEGSPVIAATLRFAASAPVRLKINETEVLAEIRNGYYCIDIKKYTKPKDNRLSFETGENNAPLIASLEVEYENGKRYCTVSDGTWLSADMKKPVGVLGVPGQNGLPVIDTSKEIDAYYKINLPDQFFHSDAVVRLKLDYSGNKADCFIGNQLQSDNFFNGLTYTIGIDRFRELLSENEMIVRIKAFEKKPDIYFEDFVDISDCTVPQIKKIAAENEYSTTVSF